MEGKRVDETESESPLHIPTLNEAANAESEIGGMTKGDKAPNDGDHGMDLMEKEILSLITICTLSDAVYHRFHSLSLSVDDVVWSQNECHSHSLSFAL